ncbi:MAG: heparinase II/III family protein [Armatimonadetes bacterium]|nr:heparinase II/III family protein [Armatimonadota bacterium]
MLLMAMFPLLLQLSAAPGQIMPEQEPLYNWSSWKKYRAAISHPATMIKPDDLRRARKNLARYEWAQNYRDSLESSVSGWLPKIDAGWLARMIPATTPGDALFTPCPACRDRGKPAHPHGQWRWSPDRPEELACIVCGTIFPNEQYPESVALRAEYGGGQTFTYYGGEPFRIFGFATGRPSFSGCIRARKVASMTALCRQMAECYLLTGKPEYARAVRMILLRFAETYPKWLVHVGYGEYADLDPHIAALNIENLPVDELTPPPNKPDRKLHTGYWSAGRAGGVGMEGGFVRQIAEAYDFTCRVEEGGQPIYSDADRIRIEKDLLLESTTLLTADKQVNNKSVTNATAVSLVGMAVGHPGLVQFGLNVFLKTIEGWFLPDGATSESWSYAEMTLNGIHALGQAFRGYSDPAGYTDADGKRIEGLDLYRLPAYRRIWDAMYNGLQGNLKYPPIADGHLADGMQILYSELMVANYPEEARYLALLKEQIGNRLERGYAPYALYYREPGLEQKAAPPFSFPDHLFPALQVGYIRSGSAGRDSLLLLSASDWGIHHHFDSLNLYLWQNDRELLSDLGYLWDHPLQFKTVRTFAHNTVMVDGKEQAAQGRGGRFTFFDADASKPIKAMEAQSNAYPQAPLYRRTVAQIPTAPGAFYVADIFRVEGGERHDYLFHGPNNALRLDAPSLKPEPAEDLDLANIHASREPAPRRLEWDIDEAMRFQALWPGENGETFYLGDGWGQRDYRNSDVGATLPYIVRRRPAGSEPNAFITVFEGFAPGKAAVRSVRRLRVPSAPADFAVALAVETEGGTDYIVSCPEARPFRLQTFHGLLEMNGRLAVVRIKDGQAVGLYLQGKSLEWDGQALENRG